MVAASQTHRELEFISPLGKDVLLLHKFEATEELGRPYNFELTLRSTSEIIDFEALLGQNVSVRLDVAGSSERFFNGYITKFSQGENAEGFATYYATISPWLWFLQKTKDCRIFQEQNAVDIIETIFQESGYADYELRLSSSYRKREYTVEYRESNFNFVSRLMEEEGIYYFFTHEQGHHKMIICDTYSSHEMIPAYSAIPYYPPDATTIRHEDIINAWKLERKVLSGAVAVNDYDFKHSHADIKNDYTYPKEHDKADSEIYDYPAKYVTSDEGRHYARMRQEELHCAYAVVNGNSTAREFTAGSFMKMVKHPRNDQNIEYLITKVIHEVDQDAFGSTKKGASGFIYKNTFQVIESHTPFKTKSINIAPVVDGPQSAHVVGPANEEIYCDEFGRVKVTFPWDRYSKSDENSSCWIRVSQNWAGGSWGHIAIPRIGQEVIVDFLEGNPDRPIITGRTYHDKNKVPYPLPANKTKMSIKSKTHKGKGYNELRFDDAKGAEQVFVHGEKDHDIIIENDRREHIRHDRDLRVNNNRTEEISNDSSSKVDRDRSEATGRKYTTTVGEEHVVQVGKHYHLKTGKTQFLEAGKQIVIESGEELTIRSSGGFIKIDSSGITIQGKVVNVNTGGSPGTGIPVQASLAKAAMLATAGSVSDLSSPDAPSHKPLEFKKSLPSFTAITSTPAPSEAVLQASKLGLPFINFANNKLATQQVASVNALAKPSNLAKDCKSAPSKITLPKNVDASMKKSFKGSFPKGKSQERGGIIVKDSKGNIKIMNESSGTSGTFSPNRKVGKGNTIMGIYHTHPYDKSEGGHKGVSFSGADIAYANHYKEEMYVDAGNKQFMIVPTQKTTATSDDINKAFDAKLKSLFAKGKSMQEASSGASNAVAKKYGMAYYEGKDGVLKKVSC